MRGDGRSGRVVVVPDRLVNPPDGDRSELARLAAAGWGLVQLPPDGLEPAERAAALEAVVDALRVFADEGYELAALLDAPERDELRAAAGSALAARLTTLDPVR